jgi:hypothetical protein
MKLRFFAVLGLVLALLVPPLHSAGRTPRSDNPGKLCDMQTGRRWGKILIIPINGDTDSQRDLPTFFIPGTVTTGDKFVACHPILPPAEIWESADTSQAPNPASNPDPQDGQSHDRHARGQECGDVRVGASGRLRPRMGSSFCRMPKSSFGPSERATIFRPATRIRDRAG